MQGWSSNHNPANAIHHINGLMKKNHMITRCSPDEKLKPRVDKIHSQCNKSGVTDLTNPDLESSSPDLRVVLTYHPTVGAREGSKV